MSSSENYYIQILTNISIYIYRYIVPVLYIIANIGNLLSIIVFLKKSWRKNVCVFYLLVCLFYNSCYINSTILASILSTGLNIRLQNSSRIICKLFYYISYVFTRLLSTILILASIDRLLISSQNIDTRLYSSKRLGYFSVSISTCIWIIFYIHIFIRIDIYEMYPNIFVCNYDTSGIYFQFITFSSLIINILSVLTLSVSSILTFKNVRRIRSVPRQQRRQQQQFRSMTKKDFQLLRCLYVYDIVYVVCSIWSSAFSVYLAARKSPQSGSLQTAIETFLSQLATLSHHLSFCLSFFIFLSVSKAFRQEIKRMIYKIWNQNLVTIQEQNDTKDIVELNVVGNTNVLSS